jgi:predicted metal-dependent HD superfamily phosphohydrolase
MADHEQKRARKWLANQTELMETRFTNIQHLEEVALKQKQEAENLHAKAVKVLRKSNAVVVERQARDEEARKAGLDRRVQNVLELKSDLAGVKNEIVASAEKTAHKRDLAAKSLAASKESMLASGLNPYQEFRRKDIDQAATKETMKLTRLVEEGKTRVLSDMEQEKRRVARTDAEAIKTKVPSWHTTVYFIYIIPSV